MDTFQAYYTDIHDPNWQPRITLASRRPLRAWALARSACREALLTSEETPPVVGANLPGDLVNKLVRDNIPDIIRADGLNPIIHVADDQEYAAQLRAKLTEEVDEFLTSDNDLEELADILEVLHALAANIGSSPAELEKLRAAKGSQRGGFEHRIIWSGNRGQEMPS